MKKEALFTHFVTLALLTLSAVYKAPLFAYASVVSLGLSLGKDTYDRIAEAREAKANPDEALKRSLADMNVRVTRLEHGVATRGF